MPTTIRHILEMTRELTDMPRRNNTIDWQKKISAKANMRRPPKWQEESMETAIRQCGNWTGFSEETR